jgi:hypothetical protein
MLYPGVRPGRIPSEQGLERTTGLEPATLTLAMKAWEGVPRARLGLW